MKEGSQKKLKSEIKNSFLYAAQSKREVII